MVRTRIPTVEHSAGLRAAYARCRSINRAHGRSYYLATALLPAHKRPHVHALYGFARWADDIVDAPDAAGEAAGTAAWRQARLEEWEMAFRASLTGAPVRDPLLPAVLHTIQTYES